MARRKTSTSDLKTLRRRLRRASEEHLALLTFFGASRAYISRVRTTLNAIPRSEVNLRLQQLRQGNAQIRVRYGVKVPTQTIVAVIKRARNAPAQKELLYSKHGIDHICDHYDKVLPTYHDLPLHARIAFPSDGFAKAGRIEVTVMETLLFEEMCALFNLYHRRRAEPVRSKIDAKTLNALAHAVGNGAYYFVEAYMNGLACDAVLGAFGDIELETKAIFAEWDPRKNRRKRLSMRDKILRFPRLILGLEHPPLTESNCQELAYFLDDAKRARDAVVHPSVLGGREGSPSNEMMLVGAHDWDIEKTVDSAIRLVRRVNSLAYPRRDLAWLVERDVDGTFPESTFD